MQKPLIHIMPNCCGPHSAHANASRQYWRRTLLGFLALAGILYGSLVAAQSAPKASGQSSLAARATVSPIISPAELKALIDRKSVRVLDIREVFQNDGKTPNYAAGHIPGAISAPYSAFRGPDSNPGSLLSDAKLSGLFNKWGLATESHIVIAPTGSDATDFGGAARVYWTLKLAGFQRLSILEGGLGAWLALKYPTETTTPAIVATKLEFKLDRSQVVSTNELAELIKSSTGGGREFTLTDSRSEDFFSGKERHSVAARAGTIPSATNFDHEEWFQINTSKLLPKAQLESLAKNAGLLATGDVISFCNTGHWSATTWFVLSEVLGKKNVRMYPESAIGWSRSRNPMANEPAKK